MIVKSTLATLRKSQTLALLAGIVGTLGFAGAVKATPTISVGTVMLAANTDNQAVPITVSGGDSVTGLQLEAVLGDGTGSNPEPVFVGFSFGAGTIWAAHPTTTSGGPLTGFPQDAQPSVNFTTTGDTTSAAGTAFIAYISTKGFNLVGQTFAFKLSGTELGANSTFIGTSGGAAIPTTIVNGTIQITPSPEPASLSLFGLGALGLLRRRRSV